MDRDQTFPLLLPHRLVLRGHTDNVLSLAMSEAGSW